MRISNKRKFQQIVRNHLSDVNDFVNDLFFWIPMSELHEFVDDNTIPVSENTAEKLIHAL